MRALIASLLLLCTTAFAAPKVDPAMKALSDRAYALTGNLKGLYAFFPKRTKIPEAVGGLVGMTGLAKSGNQPLIIYCPDAELGTRIITAAFTKIRRNTLRGTTIICAVGLKNDSSIRPVVEATGAKLFVEPLP